MVFLSFTEMLFTVWTLICTIKCFDIVWVGLIRSRNHCCWTQPFSVCIGMFYRDIVGLGVLFKAESSQYVALERPNVVSFLILHWISRFIWFLSLSVFSCGICVLYCLFPCSLVWLLTSLRHLTLGIQVWLGRESRPKGMYVVNVVRGPRD